MYKKNYIITTLIILLLFSIILYVLSINKIKKNQIDDYLIYSKIIEKYYFSIYTKLPNNIVSNELEEFIKKNPIEQIVEEVVILDSTTNITKYTQNKLIIPDKMLKNNLNNFVIDELKNNTKNIYQKVKIDKNKLNLNYKIIQLSENMIKVNSTEKKDFNDYVIDKYPNSNGLIKLSSIIYNNDRSIALVSYVYICGYKCGNAQWVLLKKENNRWKIIDKYLLFVT